MVPSDEMNKKQKPGDLYLDNQMVNYSGTDSNEKQQTKMVACESLDSLLSVDDQEFLRKLDQIIDENSDLDFVLEECLKLGKDKFGADRIWAKFPNNFSNIKQFDLLFSEEEFNLDREKTERLFAACKEKQPEGINRLFELKLFNKGADLSSERLLEEYLAETALEIFVQVRNEMNLILGLHYCREEKKFSDKEIVLIKQFGRVLGYAIGDYFFHSYLSVKLKWVTVLLYGLNEMIYRFAIPQGVYDYVNPVAAEKLFGLTPQQLVENPGIIRSVIHPDFQPGFDEEWKNLLNGIVLPVYEYKVIKPDGSERWIYQTNKEVFDEDGNLVAIEGSCLDITELKNTEESLRESETKHRLLFDNAGEGILMLDKNGFILEVNQKAADILKTEKEYFYEKDIKDLSIKFGFEKKAFLSMFKSALGGEIIAKQDFKINVAAGEPVVLTCQFIPISEYLDDTIIVLLFGDITQEKHFQEELLASEEMFRGVVEHFPISIEVYNRNGYQIPLGQLSGLTEDRLKWPGVGFNILTDEHYKGLGIFPEINAVFEGQNFAVKEWVFDPAKLGQAGSLRYFRSRIYPIKNSENKLLYVVLAHDDITDRKRTEQELIKSEERFRLLAERSPDGILIHQDNKVIYANPEACRIMAAGSAEEIVGRNPIEFVHPDYIKIVADRIKQTYEFSKDLNFFEEKFIRLDGEVIEVEVAASFIQYLGRPSSQVVFRDISERKKIERALQDSKKYLSITLNSIGDGVIAADKDGKITRMNKVAEVITAWSSFEALGQDLFDVFNISTNGDESPQIGLFQRLIDSGEKFGSSNQAVLLSRQGEEYRISYSAAPIKNEEGHILGIVLAFRDETEEFEKDRLIKENQDILKTVVRSSSIGIAMSVDRTISWVNDRMVSITGYSSEELVGQNTRMLYLNNEEYHKVEDLRYVEVREYGTRVIESKFKHKSGKLLDVLLSATPLDEKNISKGVLFTILDISTRKSAERALKENEENLEITLRSIGDGVVATDRTGKITRMNMVAERLTGWNMEEALGNQLSDVFKIINSATGEKVENPVEQVLKNGKIVGLANHTLLISKNGTRYQIADSAAPILNDEKQIVGVVLVFRDVTEEYEKDRLIKENQATMQSIFNSMLVGVAVANNRKIQWVNKKFLEMTGYELEDVIGQSTKKLYALSGDYERIGLVYNDLQKYSHKPMELRLCRKDGSEFDVLLGVSPLDPNDTSKGISFSLMDITDRKKTEEALRESEKRFALVLDAANDGMWDWNIQTQKAFLDINYYAMLGYENNEFPARFEEWEKRLHPEDRRPTIEAMTRYINDELETYQVEFRFLKKSGEYMWILSRGKIVERDEKGNPVRMVGTHTDITERKQAEEQLHLDEIRLETLLELNQMQDKSIEDLTRFVLEEGVRLTNSELGYLAFVNEDETQLIMHTFSKQAIKKTEMLANGPPYILEIGETGLLGEVVRQRKPVITNEYRPDNPLNKGYPPGHVEIKNHMSIPVFDGEKVVAVAGVGNKPSRYVMADSRQLTLLMDGLWNIIKRKEDHEEMARLRNLLQNITDSMPSILITVNDQMKVIQWNKEAEDFTGIKVSEVEGENLIEIFPQLSGQSAKIINAIQKRIIQKEEKINWSTSEKLQYMDITVFPLLTDGINGAVIRIDNVTDRIRMEEMMIQSEKMLSVGGLAAGMAHEINNPLAGIVQSMQVIQNRLFLDTSKNAAAAQNNNITLAGLQGYIRERGIDKMVENVLDSGKRAASIVSNMLSFSRKSAYKFEMHNIASLLDKTVELVSSDYDLRKKYDFRQIKIIREYASDIVPVRCEGTKIQQVFLNILKNGAQAMASKDYLNETPAFILRLYMERNFLRIEIEDNGPGMDVETRKRIFEPFFTTKDVGEGVGLGLSVSYFIITENHNGTMSAESVLGSGTKFSIGLPLH